MPKRLTAYRDWIGGKLSEPRAAAKYLNAARKESPEAFFKALRRVAESHQMAKVAEEAGVSRESLYRMTMASSNPTHTSFEGILRALGLDYTIVPAPVTAAEIRNGLIAQPLSSGAEISNEVFDATWKLNPSFPGYIGHWDTLAPNAPWLPSSIANPNISPAMESANSNTGSTFALAAMQPRLDHARREMGFQNAGQ